MTNCDKTQVADRRDLLPSSYSPAYRRRILGQESSMGIFYASSAVAILAIAVALYLRLQKGKQTEQSDG